MSEGNGNGWDQYQRLVLDKLDSHTGWLKSLTRSVSKVETEISALKVKSGVWGILGGLIPVLVLVLVYVFAKGDK